MKKTFISFFWAALAIAFLAAGCQKDTVTLKARFEHFNNGDKLHLTHLNSHWDSGDQININGTWYTMGDNGNISNVEVSSVYRAIFVDPACTLNVATTPSTVVIPASSQYTVDATTGEQKVFTPMYAYSENTTLGFKNMGAVLAINLSIPSESNRAELNIDKIEVTASNYYLWGTATIYDDDIDEPYIVCDGGTSATDQAAHRTLTLNFNNATVHLTRGGTSVPVYISIPPLVAANAQNYFTIKVYASLGGTRVSYERVQTNGSAGVIRRNQWADVPFALDLAHEDIISEGTLPDGIFDYNAQFSVSSTQKVYFSKGNLQYNIESITDGTPSGTWQFASSQYEIVGIDNITHLRDGEGLIDLFGWGTSGLAGNLPPTYYSSTTTEYATSSLVDNNVNNNVNADWGRNIIANGTIPSNASGHWRTLTIYEFRYLIGIDGDARNSRKVDGMTGHYYRNYNFDIVDYNGTIGLLIYPDATSDVTQPGSLQYKMHRDFTTDDANTTFVINMADYPGCVFLPASLQRQYNENDRINEYGIYAGILAYWSTTVNNSSSAYVLSVGRIEDVGNVTHRVYTTAGVAKYLGLPVRLVYDVPPQANSK